LGIPLHAREVRIPSAKVSARGGTSGLTANLSRWRLAHVHIISHNIDEKVKSDLKSISLPVQDWDVSIYPNPVTEKLNIELPSYLIKEGNKANIQLFNVLDANLRKDEILSDNSNIIAIDMSGIKAGSYLIIIQGKDFTGILQTQKNKTLHLHATPEACLKLARACCSY
jgi:hypothetical protein